MKEIYNLVAISKPKNKKEKKKLKKLIQKEAKVLDSKNIGQQEFVYPIKEEEEGYYFWIDFDIKADKLKGLKKKIDKLNLLRYLISKKPLEAVEKRKEEAKEKDKGEKPTKPKEEKKKKKSQKKPKKKESKAKSKKKEEKPEEERMEDLDKKLEEIL